MLILLTFRLYNIDFVSNLVNENVTLKAGKTLKNDYILKIIYYQEWSL